MPPCRPLARLIRVGHMATTKGDRGRAGTCPRGDTSCSPRPRDGRLRAGVRVFIRLADVHRVNLNRSVLARRRQPLAVRAPGHACNYRPCGRAGSAIPCPLAASHTFAVWSRLAVASRLPSGLQATLLTRVAWPRKVSTSLPVCGVPHLRRLVITPAVASRLPSGLQATLDTVAVAAQGQHFLARRGVPHLRRLVITAVASRLPSGLQATLVNIVTVAAQGQQFLAVGASHTFAVWSSLAVASRLPSGLHATLKQSRLWPLRVSTSLPVSASHTFAVWSPLPSPAACRPGSRPRS